MRSRIFWSALLFCAAAVPAAAQNFPERPLRIIVAFSTGTAADIVARQIALKLTDTLGKQVIVENREKSGRLKGLAVTGTKRSQAAPEIPAPAETLPGYEAASWYGIVVPARTPQPVIARLHGEIAKSLQQPDVRQRFLSLGGDIVSGGPDDLAKTMRGGAEKWGALVKEIEARGG